MGELNGRAVALRRLRAVYKLADEEPRVLGGILRKMWQDDPAIQAVMAPLIDEVDNLGEKTAASIAFAIFLAIISEEARNGKDIEIGRNNGR